MNPRVRFALYTVAMMTGLWLIAQGAKTHIAGWTLASIPFLAVGMWACCFAENR